MHVCREREWGIGNGRGVSDEGQRAGTLKVREALSIRDSFRGCNVLITGADSFVGSLAGAASGRLPRCWQSLAPGAVARKDINCSQADWAQRCVLLVTERRRWEG